jgi:hypothetical protein
MEIFLLQSNFNNKKNSRERFQLKEEQGMKASVLIGDSEKEILERLAQLAVENRVGTPVKVFLMTQLELELNREVQFPFRQAL